MPLRVLCIQHETFEGSASVGTWLDGQGYEIILCRLHAGESLPDLPSFDALVLMGGTMSVNDEERLPWLVAEKALIRQVINEERPILGICLGSQLIASALGASVTRNPEPEVGWFPVDLTPEGRSSRFFAGFPRTFTPCHWHGETYTLPEGALQLATSAGCSNQAFSLGKTVLGLQFHLEYTRESIDLMVSHCPEDTTRAGRYIQNAEALRAGCEEHVPNNRPLLEQMLGHLINP